MLIHTRRLPKGFKHWSKEKQQNYWEEQNNLRFGKNRWVLNNQAEAKKIIPTKTLTIHNLKDWPTSSLLHLKDDPTIAAELASREKNKI